MAHMRTRLRPRVGRLFITPWGFQLVEDARRFLSSLAEMQARIRLHDIHLWLLRSGDLIRSESMFVSLLDAHTAARKLEDQVSSTFQMTGDIIRASTLSDLVCERW